MDYIKKTIIIILGALSNLKRNKKAIDSCSLFLAPGYYKNTVSGDIVYNIKKQEHLKIKTYSSYKQNTKLALFIVKIINSLCFYKVNDKKQLYQGTELLISSSGNEYKIFVFETQVLLTKYLDIAKMQTIINNKRLFGEFYNIPESKDYLGEHTIVIETLINQKTFNAKDAFSYLNNQYLKFLKKQALHTNICRERYEEERDYYASRFGESKLLAGDDVGIVRLLTHGDMWSSNVMYDSEKYYLTDFEHVGVRFFLFDFIYFIFSEWLFNGQSEMLLLYFNGYYDHLLSDIFELLSLNFEKDRKQEYFLTFLVSMTFERWKEDISMDKKIRSFTKEFLPTYYE